MREFVRPETAARQLGMSRRALYHHIRRGHIPAYRIGRLFYIDTREMEEHIRRNRA